ncbi:DEAD/DEAH-box DNA helicase [Mycena chlorophos]|uniref:DNA 3'-5' helicase n=1 Tax=Mycena chlorophos TaxID=658473 RepID=A0A8H6TSQ7_MYCCL|nr:DEAD/DEAH-box DNA helicase [Mycena chlorophos]
MYADDFDQINSSPSPPERSRAMYQQDPIAQYGDYDEDEYYDNQCDPNAYQQQYEQPEQYQQPENPYDEYYDNEEPEYEPQPIQFNAPQSRPNYLPPAVRASFFSRPVSFQPQRPPPQPAHQSTRGANPLNSAGIRLNPVSDLPDMYRGIFKFPVFNAVQSTCFPTVVNSDENMVISAPTGSGKTVLFELAIIRMLKELGETFKCVYIAPTKALCSERQRDWSAKFSPLGIKCCELTGDTVHFGKGVWGDAKAATIIITTGEKWDSLTRNWADHGQILSRIQLFLVDEVHILNESRGSTLEVVVSRMKTRGSSVRFLLVSATVPNIQDIAAWIGNKRRDGPAAVFEFGESFRPCKLTRHVIAVDRARGDNDFSFARKLDYRLFAALQAHAVGKPILVFVATRKGVTTTATQLMNDYNEAEKTKKRVPWTHPARVDHTFHEKVLNELSKVGIGIHHAGMTMDDRRAVEDLYLKGVLRVVVATSTLAVGVNLPAHTVVIKGVYTFQNNASVEYSDLDVMQMLGRAGRPQFDKDGIALIMCETELESKYRQLAQGKTIVESSLHTNLAEHINSEIGLGTITSVGSAKEWLRGSFLFQRVKQNPAHYALGKSDNQSWEERVDDMVLQSIEKLRATKLINEGAEARAGGEKDALASTDFGDIMSKFYIRQSTMSLILALPERPTVFNKLRRHNDMRFEVKKVEKTSDKTFLLIQAVLSGISLNSPEYKCNDSQLTLEAYSVFKHVARIARVIVEVAIVKKRGAQLKHGLELLRCLTVKAWEDRPVVLKQIESIGEKSIKVLAENGITSLALLAKQEPYKIETLLNRRTPFGLEVLASVHELPTYSLSLTEVEVHSNGGKDPVEIDLSITCGLVDPPSGSGAGKAKKQKGLRMQMTAILTLTSDLEFLDFRRIPTKALKETKTFEITAELTKPSQSVVVLITSETIAGVSISQTYKPNIPYKEYPTRDTRPPTALDLDLAGLEDDPDFWNVAIDEMGNFEETTTKDLVVRDLTQAKKKTAADTPVPHNNEPPRPKVPEKLPNGNYQCNHNCKDKTKCRHMCCRDGLPEPPRAPKKRTGDDDHTGTSTAPAKKTSKATPKPDTTIQQLEKLHERTNVALKLPQGSRLKLPSSSSSASPERSKPKQQHQQQQQQRKRKPNLDFTVELTDLTDGAPPATTLTPAFDMHDDDDLPEAHELLLRATQRRNVNAAAAQSDTSYSDSEMDSLIRKAPSELLRTGTKNKSKSGGGKSASSSSRKKDDDDDDVVVLTPAVRKRKERAVPEKSPRPAKKAHFEIDIDEIEDVALPSIDYDALSHDTQPLFSTFEDEFYVDVDLPTPPLTDDDRKTSDVSQPPVGTPEAPAPAPVSQAMEGIEDGCGDEEMNDDLREFDAWLNSGMVEIVG